METHRILQISQTCLMLLHAVFLTVFPLFATAHPRNVLIKRAVNFDSVLTLISVEREPTPEGNKFTVRYTKNVDNLTFRVQDDINPPREPTVTQDSEEIWAASFVVPVIPNTSQWFLMRDALHLVALRLNNSDTSPGTQNIPELPVIQFDPPGEAVYSPDEDVNLQVTVPRNNQTGQVVDNMQKMFYGVDFQTMKMHFDYDDDEAFTIGRPETLDDGLQVSVIAHTSRRPMSGYLQLSTQVLDTGGPLLKQIQISRSLLIKPVGQVGPYPAGYLAFLDVREKLSNGHELHRCSVGYECLIFCSSVGSSISTIEVKQIAAGGNLVKVPSAEEGLSTSAESREIFWKFRAEEDSGDSEGITSFQCQVTDLTHGTVVTKVVDVRADIQPAIDHARSGITMEDDPIYPNRKIVTFHCAISGRPLPDVTFNGGTVWQFNMIYADIPDDVISTGQNEAVATRVVTLDAAKLAQAVQRINSGQDTGPTCSVFSPYHGNIRHDFYPTPA